MKFNLEIHRKALKFLEKLNEDAKGRILEKIKKLRETPFLPEAVKIQGRKEELYRIRVGNYRILYYIDQQSSTIFILKVDKRPRVYRK